MKRDSPFFKLCAKILFNLFLICLIKGTYDQFVSKIKREYYNNQAIERRHNFYLRNIYSIFEQIIPYNLVLGLFYETRKLFVTVPSKL
jgi:hypothetical protein